MPRVVVDVSPLRRHPHFRRLWAGQIVSGMGSQLTLVAVSYQAYHLSHSTLIVGMIGLAQLFPLLAGALWGGTLADAMDRRRVLVVTQVAMAAASAGLVANAALPHPHVWALFVCTAAGAAFQGVDWPARRAALPMLVSADDVTPAVALQTMVQQVALVVGPAVGGVLIASLGLSAVFGIDVATFGVALAAAVLLPALVPSGGGTPMGMRSMVEGFRHLQGQKLLSASYWIDLNAMIFGMPRAVFPALGTGLFGGGAGVVGLLYAAPGPGPWSAPSSPAGAAGCVTRVGLSPPAWSCGEAPSPWSGSSPSWPWGWPCWPWPGRPTWSPPSSARPSSSGRCPTTCRAGCRAPSSPWSPVVPGSVTPRPAWRQRWVVPSSPCGRAAWPVSSGWPSCCGGHPSCGGTPVVAPPSPPPRRPVPWPRPRRS